MLSSISTFCFMMAALTFGFLAGHHLTKDYLMQQKLKELRKEYE